MTPDNIISGIVSGIVTSILIFVFSMILKRIAIPYYTDVIYKGVKISGTWKGSRKGVGPEVKVVCTIVQKAFQIDGTFAAETVYINNPENNYSNNYKISGFISGNMLTLTYDAIDPSRTGTGVLMFQIVGGGKKLIGKAIHSEDGDGLGLIEDFVFIKD